MSRIIFSFLILTITFTTILTQKQTKHAKKHTNHTTKHIIKAQKNTHHTLNHSMEIQKHTKEVEKHTLKNQNHTTENQKHVTVTKNHTIETQKPIIEDQKHTLETPKHINQTQTHSETFHKFRNRHFFSNPLFNSSTKNAASLKFHSKLLQTVYSDSFSKNFYYTTLYVGDNKVKQTYVIDTGSSIMSSPCSPCAECGKHKSPYYFDMKHVHKPLKCSSKICQLTPSNACLKKKLKFLSRNSCTFKVGRAAGDGISGYYMRDVVYFETDKMIDNPKYHRKTYRSYALPVGCTTAESGKYKELTTDGIMGMSYNSKSFISLLYNLKIINRDIFSLCFGLRGGYMSLGEVDKTYHKSQTIEYVPLLSSTIDYLVKVTSIKLGSDSEKSIIKMPHIASIDTGNTISYFPSIIFQRIIKHFKAFCATQNGKCGNFTYDEELGYCAPFSDRESLFKTIYHYWPNITLEFGESEYIWKPLHYYYYYFNSSKVIRKACLGFDYHKSSRIILGANFIHGHDIIFDRQNKRLGFVPSDCSRGNLILNKFQDIFGHKYPNFETTDPILMDKEIHHTEAENKFHLGDNNRDEMVDFIKGHNTELDRKEFSTINFILLASSIAIVLIIVIVVVSVLLCGKKRLAYEQQENEYSTDYNSRDNENKITFEENNTPENNLEENK